MSELNTDLLDTLNQQKLLYEIKTAKTENIVTMQHNYVMYLGLILLVLVVLFALYEVKKIQRMRQIKTRYASLIAFIDAIKYHQDDIVPICTESRRYTKTDGLTLAYYYEYPHSFLNPFRNINFPIAVTMSYYSDKTNGSGTNATGTAGAAPNGCFSMWGDYVGWMLSYSEINTKADADTIICNTFASESCEGPSGCTNYCCKQDLCEGFCRPFYEESIGEILNSATINAAGVGLICYGVTKGGRTVYFKASDTTLENSSLTFENPLYSIQRAISGGKDISEAATRPVSSLSSEQIGTLTSTGEVGDVSSLGTAGASGASATAGSDAASTAGAVGTTSAEVTTDAQIGTDVAVLATTEATVDVVPIVGAVVGVTIAIGFGIFMGLNARKSRKQQCQQYQQYCISNDAAGTC